MRAALAIAVALVSGAALAWWPATGQPASLCPLDVELGSATAAPVVGDEIEIEIVAIGCHPGTVTVTALSGVTSYRFDVDVDRGRWAGLVPERLTRVAGDLTIVANGASDTIALTPGPPAGPVRAWVGPRTIVADGVDETMAVAAPVDRFGNPVGDRTMIETFRQRGASVERRSGTTVMGLSWTVFAAGTVTERAEVWIDTDDTTGERVTVLEVPGPVESVELEPPPARLPAADGRSAIPLLTTELTDEHGNVLPDGIGGQFVIDGPDGLHVIPGVVTAGRLRATWVAPAGPGVFTIAARVQGQHSPVIEVVARPAVEKLPATARPTDDGLVVEVGPVISSDGGLVADGTPVSIGSVTTTLSSGWATAVVPGTAEAIEIEVLGSRVRVEVPS